MAVPKKRTSSSRRGMRRSHHALKEPTNIGTCETCGELVERHQVCKACGHYRGRSVLETD